MAGVSCSSIADPSGSWKDRDVDGSGKLTSRP